MPQPRVDAPAAGTYQVTVYRSRYLSPATYPTQGVLVLQPGRLPRSVAQRLSGNYFTYGDRRTILGEACVQWDIPLWSRSPVFALRNPGGTAWRALPGTADSLQLVLYQTLDARYVITLTPQPDRSLAGHGEMRHLRLTSKSPSRDSVAATRIGDADPTQCLPEP